MSPKVASGERDPCPAAGDGTGGTGGIGSSLEPDGLPKGGPEGKDLFWFLLLALALGRAGLLEAGMEMGSPVDVVRSLAIK